MLSTQGVMITESGFPATPVRLPYASRWALTGLKADPGCADAPSSLKKQTRRAPNGKEVGSWEIRERQ